MNKLIKNNPLLSVYSRLVFLISWCFLVAIGLVQSITYSGFVAKHLHIDITWLLYLITGLFLTLHYLIPNHKKLVPGRILSLNKILLIALTTVFTVFFILEKFTYTNFVYSRFHIQQVNLFIPLLLSLFLFILGKADLASWKKKIGIGFFFICLTVWVLISNITQIDSMFDGDIRYMLKNPKASYDDKMAMKTGKTFYSYIMFIRKYTPEDSTLLIPPQAMPWPETGNGAYMRYFIYPRDFVNGRLETAWKSVNDSNIDFVLLDWGETEIDRGQFTHGWPKFDVPAEEVLIMESDGTAKVEKGDFIYEKYKNKEVWGLIKVKK